MSFDVGTIGVIVVLVVILAFLYFRKRNDEKGKEEIKVFMSGLYLDFEAIIIDYIDKMDIFNMENLALAEKLIIDSLLGVLWNKALKALEEYVTDPMTKIIMKKMLTREKIAEFAKEIFESIRVQAIYTNKYNDAIVAANKEAIILEAEMTKKNQEIEDNIPVDFREVENIDPNSIINMNGEIVKEDLNPPVDEESEFINTEDSSMEIIDFETEQ